MGETFSRVTFCEWRIVESAFGQADDRLRIKYQWADSEKLAEAMANDDSIESFSELGREEGETLYQIELTTGLIIPRYILHAVGAGIEHAYGNCERWIIEVRYPDRESLSRSVEKFEEYGIEMEFETIKSDQVDDLQMGALTEKQREILYLAVERGYYEIPQRVSLQDLADELDITHQSASERLRRAHQAFIKSNIRNSPTAGEMTGLDPSQDKRA